MSVTSIPGSCAKHAIITPTCVANRGVGGAWEEAESRLRDEFYACAEGNPTATFHVVLTVERATASKEPRHV